MKTSLDLIKKLRQETQASVADCKTALEEAKDDHKKALKILRKKGFERAEKKEGRVTEQGIVESYVHQNAKIGVLVELLCETDFVARNEEFKRLAHEIAMQIAAMAPSDTESLLKQEYIRDNTRTVSGLIKETIAKVGENITIKRFSRLEISK